MKFREIFRFEFRYQIRHVSPWLIFTFLFLFGFLIPRIGTPAEGVYVNSNSSIAFITVFAGMIGLLLSGVVAGDAATRDLQTRMHSMLYTTAITKIDYLGGRFLAAFLINALMQSGVVAGMLLSFYGPAARTELLGPFHLASYLTAYGFIALPNTLIITAIQFAVATQKRRAMAAYIISGIMLVTSQVASTSLDWLFNWGEYEKLFDLTGTTNVAAVLETWTPFESNNKLIELKGFLLGSRLVWLGIAISAFTTVLFRFRFHHVTENSNSWNFFKRKGSVANPAGINSPTGPVTIPHVTRRFDFRTHARQAVAIAFSSFRLIVKSRGGFAFIAVLAVGAALFSREWMQYLGVPLFPRTEEVLRFFAPSLTNLRNLWVVIPFLTIVYSGEVVWREREAGINELSDPTPVPDAVLFTGQFLGLSLVIMLWMALLMAGAILLQVKMDYYHFEIDVYLRALFGLQLVNYILFALLVLVVHVLVNQKYLGHMMALAILLFLGFSSKLGIENKLLVYASDTGWSYSDMRGFGAFIGPWLWFKFYWAAWALLFAIAATAFWMRSKETGFRARLQLAKHRLTRYKPMVALAGVLIVVSGGFILINTSVLNNYLTTSEKMARLAGYEQRYGRYENVKQPVTTGVKLQVDIYPGEREANVRGTYHLVNKNDVSIDTIHIATALSVNTSAISFNRTAREVLADEAFGHHIYALEKPLQPGDSLQLNFNVHIKPRGFSNSGIDPSLAANGTYFNGHDLFPAIGYQPDRRIRAAGDRKKYGLAPRPEVPSLYDVEARKNRDHAAGIDFDVVVSTVEDQTALAPGTLQRSWTEKGRRYFHYVTDAPIHNQYAFFSAKYGVHETQWSDSSASRSVSIQIFHHPTHHQNLDRMAQSVQASLKYYTKQFGPYPYSYFRIIEHPGPGRGMHAEATTIDYMEGFSLMNPKDLDLPFHIVAHETAHQWWGAQLTPAFVEGLGVLVESFATFSAMQVVEETLGHEHLRSYLRMVREEYETPRSRYAPPLLQANSAFMNYRKGPFALYTMTQYIGKDRVNDVLRVLLKEYRPDNATLPTTLDLYRELQAVTPDSLQYLPHDLFASNTYWELETERIATEQIDTTTWAVTLDVLARKLLVDSTGAEIDVPMNDWIQVGVFPAAEKGKTAGESRHLGMYRIKSGRQTIKIIVPWKPVRGGIDPNHLMIDLERGDNIKRVKTD